MIQTQLSMATTSFDDLPEESTAEILLRLSVKDLIRSTSVNKTWYSLINNPSFISTQIHRCISQCDYNAVLIVPPITSHQNYCSLISAETSSIIEKFDIPFETRTRSLRLVTQIHGMLLLTDLHTEFSSRELYLWNPYVKRHRALVSTCFKKHLADRDDNYYLVAMGFDKATDDYKVIRIVYVKDAKGKLFGEVAPKVEIYSFRKNTWRKMKNFRVPRLVNEHGIYFGGCYYWLEVKQPGTEEARTCYGNKLWIMSFDFHTQLFGEFKVPHDVPDDLGKISPHKLMQFEDSLALCVVDKPIPDKPNTLIRSKADISFPHCIWLMRQENGVVTWTLRFRAALKDSGYPLGITKNGTLMIESVHSKDLNVTNIVSYNLKSMIRKDHGFGKAGGPETSLYVLEPCTVDTSFPESLVMYDGGKSLLKFAEQAISNQTVVDSMTAQNAVLQEPLEDPTEDLGGSQYIHQTPTVDTVKMNVQEEHVVGDVVVDTERVRHINVPVEEKGKDQLSSSMGNGSFGLWQGHEVNSEFVCLLDRIMDKYPETFEHFTAKNKKLCTRNLNMLCTTVNDFNKSSMTEIDSEIIVEYRDLFTYLQNRGFNVSWAVSRLNYIEHLRFSKPLIPELYEIDCRIDEDKRKLQELQAHVADVRIKLRDLEAYVDDAKTRLQDLQILRVEKLTEIEEAFGTMGTNLAVGFVGDDLLPSP